MPPKSATATETAASLNLLNRIQNIRKALINSNESVFLGTPDAFDQVMWFQDDRESYVAKNVQTTDNASLESASKPDPVKFSMIARITRNDTFVTPDGNYRGPSDYIKHFDQLKLTIALGRDSELDIVQLNEDFNTAYSTLTKLKEAKAGTDSSVVGAIGVSRADLQPKIKLRHEVFSVTESAFINEETGSSSAQPKVNELQLAGYPVKSVQAKAEVAEMISSRSHELVPLPAYEQLDDRFKPVELLPLQYNSHLEGALTVVEFLFAHNYFSKEKKHCFMADVYSIYVIDPRRRQPASPRKLALKRKAAPDFATPSNGKGKARAV
ncbi:hypothetical protein EV361DRAFT_874324 [Lentinula raphanica]|nr:hypothetical protein EV361DRAFT_874324 [Lentinula raphanica]